MPHNLKRSPKTVLVSIHDVSPYFSKELDLIHKEFENYNKSFLITPKWNSEFELTPDFVSVYKNEDTIQHGYTHFGKKKTAGSMELYGLGASETKMVIEKGLNIFEKYFKKKPKGFIPPNWCHNKYSESVLKDLNFKYTEGRFYIRNLEGNSSFFNIPITYDFGRNKWIPNLAHLFSSILVNTISFNKIRVAIHPMDIKNGFLNKIKSMLCMLTDKGYEFKTYQQFIEEANP